MVYGVEGSTKVVRISSQRVIKGPCHNKEAQTMQYVAEQASSIPVPRVHRVYQRNGGCYIEMDYVPGINLDEVWRKGILSQHEKQNIVQELARYLQMLRVLKAPDPEAVCSLSGGACHDQRLGSSGTGPFESHAFFHDFLRGTLTLESWGESVSVCHQRSYQSKFTHGDLSPWNIMIHEGRISGIIDWEFSGWYPEYWEFTKARYACINMDEWFEMFRNGVLEYDEELEAERALWKKLGTPGDQLAVEKGQICNRSQSMTD